MSTIYQVSLASSAAILLGLTGCQQEPAGGEIGPTETAALTAADLTLDNPAPPPAQADNAVTSPSENGLCAVGEAVIFSCQLENEKIASVCGTTNNSREIIAQYRYGKRGAKPELTWPDVDSTNRLTFASVPYSGGGEAQLHFRRGANQYVVYSRVIRTNFTAGEPNDPSLEDGIFVRKGDKIIAWHSCTGPKIAPIDYEKAQLYAEKSGDEIVEFEY